MIRNLKLMNTLNKKLILIFLFALSLRFIIIAILGQEQNLHENGAIAYNLVTGKGFSMVFFPGTPNQETCAMAPFYPFFIAFFYIIFGINSYALLAIQIVQVFIGAFTIFPIYRLTRRFFSNRIALWSSLIFAIYPDFIYSVYVIHQLTITTFLIVILIYLNAELMYNLSKKRAVFLGFLYGFSLLVEPVIISIIVLTLLWFIISGFFKKYIKQDSINSKIHFISLKEKLKIVGIICIFCLIVILPWMIRCYTVYGRFVFIKFFGFNFWRGNNPEYAGTKIPPWFNYKDKWKHLNKEGEIDQVYFNLAIEYIINHIPETIGNILFRILEFWWFPVIIPREATLLKQYFILRVISYAPLLFLFILAIILNRKRIIELFPLLIPILGFTLMYSISYVLPRYRVPIQPIIFIFSAYSLVRLLTLISEHLTPKLKRKLNLFNFLAKLF